MSDDYMIPVRKYFKVEDAPRNPNMWLVVCERCGSMWHLDKELRHPGNVLHLLNHARGHDEKKPYGRRRRVIDALNDK